MRSLHTVHQAGDFMTTSSEMEQEIRQRSERRRQELTVTIGGGVLGQNNLSPTDSADSQMGMDKPVSWTEMRRRCAGGKENESPTHTTSYLLYPVRPARSGYNSPLIKTNRSPLWKSPPPYEGCSNQLSPNSKSLFGNKDEVRAENSWFPTYHAKSPFSTNATEESHLEEKDLKEHSNCRTIIALRKSGQHSFVLPNISNVKNINSSIKTFIAPDSVPERDDHNLRKENSTIDIEDTYDIDRFLKEALRSVINLNSTVTEGSTEDLFHSVESFRTPNQIQPTSTIGSSFHLMKPIPQKKNQNSKVSYLFREAETHQQVMAQASKALTICRSSKAFFNSASLVDAERLLLLASLRHKAVLDDMKAPLPFSEIAPDLKGQLYIAEVSAHLKEDALKWGKGENDRGLWFLCVMCYGQQVLASDAVAFEPGARCINFTGNMELSNLPASFVASLQIYTLRTCRPKQSNQLSKIIKACKPLRRQTKSCYETSGSTEQLLHLRNPAFALTGSVSIELSRVSRSQPQNLHLEKVPLMSPLQGSASVHMETSLTSSVQLGGFLTIHEKVGESHAWQRRWCLLRDLCMHFWNYPADQDEKVPLNVIDLRCSSSDKIEVAPRHLCPRSRTLMLETTHMNNPYDINTTIMECETDFTIIRFFLSCDSAKDMNEWTYVLNQNLSSIKAWKIKECNHHKRKVGIDAEPSEVI